MQVRVPQNFHFQKKEKIIIHQYFLESIYILVHVYCYQKRYLNFQVNKSAGKYFNIKEMHLLKVGRNLLHNLVHDIINDFPSSPPKKSIIFQEAKSSKKPHVFSMIKYARGN